MWTGALRQQFLCRYRPEWLPLHPEWKLNEANLRCPLEGPGALELCQAAYVYPNPNPNPNPIPNPNPNPLPGGVHLPRGRVPVAVPPQHERH